MPRRRRNLSTRKNRRRRNSRQQPTITTNNQPREFLNEWTCQQMFCVSTISFQEVEKEGDWIKYKGEFYHLSDFQSLDEIDRAFGGFDNWDSRFVTDSYGNRGLYSVLSLVTIHCIATVATMRMLLVLIRTRRNNNERSTAPIFYSCYAYSIGAAKTYHLPQWDGFKDPRKLQILREIVLQYGRDPRVAQLAVEICRHRL